MIRDDHRRDAAPVPALAPPLQGASTPPGNEESAASRPIQPDASRARDASIAVAGPVAPFSSRLRPAAPAPRGNVRRAIMTVAAATSIAIPGLGITYSPRRRRGTLATGRVIGEDLKRIRNAMSANTGKLRRILGGRQQAGRRVLGLWIGVPIAESEGPVVVNGHHGVRPEVTRYRSLKPSGFDMLGRART